MSDHKKKTSAPKVRTHELWRPRDGRLKNVAPAMPDAVLPASTAPKELARHRTEMPCTFYAWAYRPE